MNRHIMLKRLVAFGAGTMLLAAACTPSGTSTTPLSPIGTDSDLGTSIVGTAVPTVQATAGGLSTAEATDTGAEGTAVGTAQGTAEGNGTAVGTAEGNGTAVGTAVGTAEGNGTAVGTAQGTAEGNGTAVGTAVGTAQGTAVGTAQGNGTAVGTAQGTAVGTQSASTTGTPNAENMPSVLLSSELIGSMVVDQTGASVGEVQDLLIDDAGLVQYAIIDATTYMGDRVTDATGTPAATAQADSTQSAMNEGIVAVPMTNLTVNSQNTSASAADDSNVLVYDGTSEDLNSMGGFDMTLLDQEGFMLDTTDSTVASSITYDGLIRASRLDQFNLQNTTGDELGQVQDLIVDLNQGMVQYGVVDFGGFVGTSEQITAVPWNMLTVERATGTTDSSYFTFDVTADQLQNAPTIDVTSWPTWQNRIDGQGDWAANWNSDINTFWDTAASQ